MTTPTLTDDERDPTLVVTLLFFDGCPNWQTTNDNLEALAVELGFEFVRCHVETDEDAQTGTGFAGAPSVSQLRGVLSVALANGST